MNFVDGIKKILDLSLPDQEGTLRDIINSCVKNILENRKSIIKGNVPIEPIRSVIALICSNGGRWASLSAKARKQLEGRNPMYLLNERELSSF